MLRAVGRVPCWAGIKAGSELQFMLARWLCDEQTTPASVREPEVRALHGHAAVQDWLWTFLYPRADQTRLLDAAKRVASHALHEKQALRRWLDIVGNVVSQFQDNPPQWPATLWGLPQWGAFQELMVAFYEKWDSKGLPFKSNGMPTAGKGVTYSQFVTEFKAAHSDSVCVVCGDCLGNLQVDHWISKASYPVLSIAPDNLLPMCHVCNEAPGKGMLPVFLLGAGEAFLDWFHPHHRSAHGRMRPQYESQKLSIQAVATNVADNERVANLDKLIKLSEHWTREFKAEYRNKQKELRQLIEAGHLIGTAQHIDVELERSLVRLVADRPNYHVHRVLLECAREPARLSAWMQELS